MKILLLNPQIDAAHAIPRGLKARGIALLFSTNVDEAWRLLKLHESNVDLAIIHADPAGLGILDKLKAESGLSDLPVILTTEGWSETECAKHQQSSKGANAYLPAPYTEAQIVAVIEGVLGEKIGGGGSVAAPPPRPAPAFSQDSSVQLESTSAMSSAPPGSPSDGTIVLEAPPELSGSISLTSTQPENLTLSSGNDGGISLSAPDGGPTSQTSIPTAGPDQSSIDIGVPTTEAPSQPSGIGIELSPPAAPVAVDAVENEPEISPAMSDLPLTPPPALEFEMPGSSAPEQEPSLSADDPEAAQEMPYLYGRATPSSAPPTMNFALPVGDAVVPGGAAHSPDTETLKKYLLLREQDVAALSSQLRTCKDQIAMLEQTVREERARNVELTHTAGEQKKRLEGFDREKAQALEALQAEMSDLRFQAKAKTDKARILEIQVREAHEEIERIKERVRVDIRKIRVREKELENKLEITKKDSEALIAARENKIIELKRKLDLLEFNMDLLQDQYMREKEESANLRERLAKAAQVVRVAGGLLDSTTPEDSPATPAADRHEKAS
ncbi:MAG: hypothetical protein ACXWPM_13390 [Bdellovibrionota bacterium]